MGSSGSSAPAVPAMSPGQESLNYANTNLLNQMGNILSGATADAAQQQQIYQMLSGLYRPVSGGVQSTYQEDFAKAGTLKKLVDEYKAFSTNPQIPSGSRQGFLDQVGADIRANFGDNVLKQVRELGPDEFMNKIGTDNKFAEQIGIGSFSNETLASRYEIDPDKVESLRLEIEKASNDQKKLTELENKAKEEGLGNLYNELQRNSQIQQAASGQLLQQLGQQPSRYNLPGAPTSDRYAGIQGLNLPAYQQSAFEKAQGRIGDLELQRYEQALRGEVPTSEALKQKKQKEFELLKENLARQGQEVMGDSPESAIGLSTAAQENLKNFNQRYGLLEDEERRAAITQGQQAILSRYGTTAGLGLQQQSLLGGQEAQRYGLETGVAGQRSAEDLSRYGTLASTGMQAYGLNQGTDAQRFSQLAGLMGQTSSPQYFGAGYNPASSLSYTQASQSYGPSSLLSSYGGLSSAYGQAMNPYLQQQQLGYQGQLAQYNANAQNQAGFYNLLGTGIGTAVGLGIRSSRKFKKDIKEVDRKEEDMALSKLSSKKLYRWKYKEEPKNSKGHIGYVTEEAPEDIISDDGNFLDVASYMGLLTSAVRSLARKMDKMPKRRSLRYAN